MSQKRMNENIAYAKELRLKGCLPEDFDGFFFRYDGKIYSANIMLSRLLEDNMVASLTDTSLKRVLIDKVATMDGTNCQSGYNCTCPKCIFAFTTEIDMISENINSLDRKYKDMIAFGYIYKGFFYNAEFSLTRALRMPDGIGPGTCIECSTPHYRFDSEWGFHDYCDVCCLYE